MPGEDRVRSCPACRNEVHNFEALTAKEVASLITARGYDLSDRLLRGEDGRILTAEGTQRARHSAFRLRSLMIMIARIAAALGPARFMGQSTVTAGQICRPPPATPPAPGPPSEGGG